MADRIRPSLAYQEAIDDTLQFLEDIGIFLETEPYCILGIGPDGSIYYSISSALLKVPRLLSASETLPVVILYDSEHKAAYLRMTYSLELGDKVIKDLFERDDISLDIQNDFLNFKGKYFLKVGA